MHIKNLTNSPYSLVDADGKSHMLPSHGELDIDPHPMHVGLYRNIGYFEVTESAPTKPAPTPETDPRDALRAEYLDLSGENADKRWSESRLRTEIDALLES